MKKPQKLPTVLGGVFLLGALPAAALFGGSQERGSAREQEADPAEVGQGATADEARLYAGDRDMASEPPQWRAIAAHERATRGPRQPIPFSHAFHVTDMQIDCMYCHTGTERADSGIIPSMEVCMGCHRVAGTGLPPIEDLRAYDARGEAVEWEWVYKLPEFVQFSHQAHLRNGLECQACHGPVEEMHRVYQWAPLTMGWCLDCHRGDPEEGDVATDHLLARAHAEAAAEAGAPAHPVGPQAHSLYPLNIDTDYGQTRAPTDCAACHY